MRDPKFTASEFPDTCPGCGLRCDICEERMCATYGPAAAVTCDAHRHCVDCEDATNPCRDCADERRAA